MRYITVLLLFISSGILAQEIKPKVQFLADSIKIGEPVAFTLSLKYPKELDIVFPDSLYDFSPYELEKKTYITTKSDDKFSYDSAVYHLLSFEIDTVQYLKLPVFVLHENDSTLIYSNEDSVILKQLVEAIPDSVGAEAAPLIENTTYINVPLQFNYPYLIIGVLILVFAIVLVFVFFGKKIKATIKLRHLSRSHKKFIERFEALRKKQNQPKSVLAENILIHWKKYLEKLENRPYTKLTTKEIVTAYNPQTIEADLKVIDRVIYAKALDNKIEGSYDALRNFAEQQYKVKAEEVRNG